MLESRVVPSTVGVIDHSGLITNGSAAFPAIAGQTAAQTGSILTNHALETAQFQTDFTASHMVPPGGASTTTHGMARSTQEASSGLPTLSSLSPSSAQAGSSDLTLTVNGSNFVPHSFVQWNGTNLATTFVSSTQLTAIVPASLLAQPGTAAVTVLAPSGGSSQPLTFTITPAPAKPALSSLSPTSALAGSSDLTLTVNGSNFVSQSVVQWNGTNLATTFVSSTQLTAVVPASLLAQPGTAAVTVFTPGAGSSQAQTFTIAAVTGMGMTFTATARVSFDGPVATFIVSNPNAQAGEFTASIDWGIGLTNAGTVAALGGGKFQVSGSITYPQMGTYPVTVTVFDLGSVLITIQSTAKVSTDISAPTLSSLSQTSAAAGSGPLILYANGSNFVPDSIVQWNGTTLSTVFLTSNHLSALVPPSLLAQPGTAAVTVFTPEISATSQALTFTILPFPLTGIALTISATAGAAFTGPVAFFSLSSLNAQASQFTATIDWGDGVTSAGTITAQGNGLFLVSGTNTYAKSGTYQVTVTVMGQGGATTTIHSTANVGAPPRAAGNGGTGTLGQESFLAMNAAQPSTGQEHHSGAVTTSPGAASKTPLLVSPASMRPGQAVSADLYWQLLSGSSRDHSVDPYGCAAHELTLALGGM
jgi:hypothetical protein